MQNQNILHSQYIEVLNGTQNLRQMHNVKLCKSNLTLMYEVNL